MTTSRKIFFFLAALAAAAGLYRGADTIAREQASLESAQKRSAQLEAQIPRARQLRDEAQHDAALLQQALASARPNPAAAMDDDPAVASTTKAWRQRLDRLKRLLADRPEWQIPELKLLNEQDWLEIAQSAELDREPDVRRSLVALHSAAKGKFAALLQAALRKYLATSGGELPADLLQLAPLCDPAIEPAMLARYAMIRTGKAGSINEPVIVEQPASAAAYQGKLSIGLYSTQTETALTSIAIDLSGNGGLQTPPAGARSTGALALSPDVSAEFQQVFAQAVEAYARDHDGQIPAQLTAETLRPYVKDPAKLEALLRTWKAEMEKHP